MSETPIRVRRIQADSPIEWVFNWLGTRWEAEACNEYEDPVRNTHAFSNTRRGAVRKAKRRLHNVKHEKAWELA